MYRIPLILLLILASNQTFCYGEGSPAAPLINLQDTVIFDLSQATCSSGFMEFPVYINSDEAVYALDFSMKFDPAHMSFITALNLKPYLVTSAWFNASDSTLRFSSYSMQPVDNNTPLVKLKFSLPSAQINFATFDSVYTLLNGDDCSKRFIDPILPVSIGITGSPTITPGDSLMLSVNVIPGVNYLWSTGQTAPVIYVNSPGTYVVTVSFVMGCKSESVINISSPSPLPVALTMFEAEQTDAGVQLYWVTASEIFNDYFDIQRLNDKDNWVGIGRITGAGSTNNTSYYRFLDSAPGHGTNLYRLKQVDFDGHCNYSFIQKAIYKEKINDLSIRVNPSPAKLYSDVSIVIYGGIEHGEGLLRVTDQKGLEVFSCKIGLSGSECNLLLSQLEGNHKLKAGNYIATFEIDGLVTNFRFVLY